MSGFPSPQSFPNDYRSEEEKLTPPQIPSSLKSDHKKLKSQTFLYPIDEADDFYDPFSDLSLFLSSKVKREIQTAGTTRKWSGKIESNLLAKIMPEFKKQFPRYRLGAAALKKVWEKVSFYYEKIQHHKGAFGKDGKLNLPLMIRENLKSCQSSPLNLPPYHLAHQIAVKISECIATLEGRRPDLDQLTKVIWAIQKNTLRDLSPMSAKSPYEEHDKLDKLIVKTLLEVCALFPNLPLKALKESIFKTLQGYGAIKPLAKKNQLTSTLSMLLAQKLCPVSLTSTKLAIPERKALETFIDLQLEYSKRNTAFSFDTHHLELVQRILALYPLTQTLPQDLPEDLLRETIREVYQNTGPLPMDSSLYVFIIAEMHLMNEDPSSENLEELENRIVAAYDLALQLPKLCSHLSETFELLIWKKLNEKMGFLAEVPKATLQVLEHELGNILMDQPKLSFRVIVRGVIQFFKKVQELPFDEKDNQTFWLQVKKKTEVWSLQNEMLCRWIHFDDQTPLFAFFKQERKSHANPEKLFAKALKRFPFLASFEKELKIRLWILEQYVWYAELGNGLESSYDRFLMRQFHLLQLKYPHASKDELQEKLEALSYEMLPLTPFENSLLAE